MTTTVSGFDLTLERLKAYAEWSHSGEAGISSRTILSAITGVNFCGAFRYYPPRDPSDFGRCVRLLDRFPELRPHLHMVAEKFNDWEGLIAAWPELQALWRRANRSQARAPKLYARIQELTR